MANIESVDLLVIVNFPEDQKGNSRKLRVVQWIVHGVAKTVKLEKRSFFKDAYGEPRTGKCDGLTIQDLEACKPHWNKIMDLMKNPPAVKTQLQAAVETAKDVFTSSEEVPF